MTKIGVEYYKADFRFTNGVFHKLLEKQVNVTIFLILISKCDLFKFERNKK